MTDCKLKLNTDNTEFLIIGTPLQRSKRDDFFPDMYPESKLHSRKSIAIAVVSSRFDNCNSSFIIFPVETLLNFNMSRIVWQG
jgi:hypothetical protein